MGFPPLSSPHSPFCMDPWCPAFLLLLLVAPFLCPLPLCSPEAPLPRAGHFPSLFPLPFLSLSSLSFLLQSLPSSFGKCLPSAATSCLLGERTLWTSVCVLGTQGLPWLLQSCPLGCCQSRGPARAHCPRCFDPWALWSLFTA